MAAQQQDFINRLEEIEKEISMSLWPKEETTQNPKFLPKLHANFILFRCFSLSFLIKII